MARKPKYGPANEVLFPEDVEWIDQLTVEKSLARQKILPLDYAVSGARPVNISHPNNFGSTRRSVENSSRLLSGDLTERLAVHGLRQSQIDFVGPGKCSNPTHSKIIPKYRCDVCCGYITVEDPGIRVGKGFQHEWCLQRKYR